MLVVVAFPFRKVRPAFWGHVFSPGGAPTHRDTAKSGSSGELPLHVKVFTYKWKEEMALSNLPWSHRFFSWRMLTTCECLEACNWLESTITWFVMEVYFSFSSHSSATCIVIQWLGGFFVDKYTDVKKFEDKPAAVKILDLSGVW